MNNSWIEKRTRMRAAIIVTVLGSKDGPWERIDITTLVKAFGSVDGPEGGAALVIRKLTAKVEIASLLGHERFDHETLLGLDNPGLPFPLPVM